jgi:phosphonopyruvate decarboxylase
MPDVIKMINVKEFYDLLAENKLDFFTGVPDSLLKDLCAYIIDNTSEKKNITTANEGNAIALAAGHYLSTEKPAIVYMQNSGLGNCVNPLVSLTDEKVYSIPLLMLIGWRGEPGKKDEPQHLKQGEITLGLLDVLGIPYEILPGSIEEVKEVLSRAVSYMEFNRSPFALVIKKGTFDNYSLQKKKSTNFPLDREDAIKLIVPLLEKNSIIISTTGKTSRELFEFRDSHEKDFLTVGSMGHSSSIALGVALEINKPVYCFDGDGSVIMHMGSLSSIGNLKPKNFKHIIFNNFAHDSVGGQPTSADVINFPEVAKANGYLDTFSAQTKDEIISSIEKMKGSDGPLLLEIKVNKGARKDLGRPTKTPKENKDALMQFLRE